jgi:dTDP-glucose 4,6-dehydratase
MDNLPGCSYGNGEAYSADERLVFWYGNVRNAELVDTLVAQADIVVHMAAESHVTRSIFDNLLFFETDVIGTQVVANSVTHHRDSIELFVHVSTSEVYGTAREATMDEEHALKPMSPYASAKAGADRLVYSYWATYGIPAVIVRPFNNYGPSQHLEKVIPRFITSALTDQPLTVHGDGSSRRDFVHVFDHCRALDAVLHTEPDKIAGEVINVGSGRDPSVLELAEMILDALDKPRDLIETISDRPGQVVRHTAHIEKAEILLGWRPSIQLEQGLASTIDWYRRNESWWRKRMHVRSIPIVTTSGKVEYH